MTDAGVSGAVKREYLAVPYEDRALARAAGARWDATAKAWFIGRGADRDALARWLPGGPQADVDPRQEFIEAMQEQGLLVVGDHPIADGKPHRVAVDGDKRDARGRYPRPSGRYALHLDGHPAGFLKNFRRGTYSNWKSDGVRLPPEELAALRGEIAQREQERAEERARAIEAAAQRVRAQAATLRPATAPTAYMKSKGIAPTIGALTDRGGVNTYLPAIDVAGTQWTMQTIRRDGFKLFEEDSRKEGTFHVVGGGADTLDALALLIVGEGYATAATVADAASQPTLAAFDAGNLMPVVLALRGRYPGKPILIVGDDDRGVELKEGHNPGREKATVAAAAVDGLAIFPMFAPGEVDTDPRRFTDFNDLATASALGRDAVKAQVMAGIDELTRKGAMRPSGGETKEAPMPDDEGWEKDATPASPASPATERNRSVDEAADRAGNGLAPAAQGEASRDVADRDARSRDVGDVPPAVARRYLTETSRWTGRRGFYEGRDAPEPAFVDRGDRLVSANDSPAVVADLIAIAEHRGWRELVVEGSDEFRREAWLRAREAGLAVEGFRPTERDLQDAARRPARSRDTRDDAAPVAPAATPQRREPAAPADERLYLSVPFAEKDAAKAAGARWDRDARAWYVADRERAAVEKWIPTAEQSRAEKVIGSDPNARAQLRTIEAVVGATLSGDPEAQRRLLKAGRDTLAERVSQDRAIPPPQLKSSDRAPEPMQSPATSATPPLPQRRPQERTRTR